MGMDKEKGMSDAELRARLGLTPISRTNENGQSSHPASRFSHKAVARDQEVSREQLRASLGLSPEPDELANNTPVEGPLSALTKEELKVLNDIYIKRTHRPKADRTADKGEENSRKPRKSAKTTRAEELEKIFGEPDAKETINVAAESLASRKRNAGRLGAILGTNSAREIKRNADSPEPDGRSL